ncbi:MAG: hypothetical protein AAF610_04100 [Pseudomonadota bacterium]
MNILKVALAAGGLGLALSSQAACNYPSAPEELPSGETESEEQMLAAQKTVKSYVQSMEAYLACLDQQLEALGDEASAEQRLMHQKRYNSAVDVMDSTASEFNQAVRTYKSRTP